jgi:hypothetical protein
MSVQKRIFLVCAVSLLSACTSVPQITVPEKITTTENVLSPAVGAPSKKDVGEAILIQQLGKKTTQRLAVLQQELRRDADFVSSGYSIIIPSGAKGYLSEGENAACFQNMGMNAGIYGSRGKSLFCLTDTNGSGAYDRAVLGSINNWGDFEIPSTPYKIEEVTVGYDPDSIKRELVFQGLRDGQIQVLYREYTAADMARAAFTQSVSYDVSTTPVIGFKGARIKVVRVTGIDIEYTVEKPFN